MYRIFAALVAGWLLTAASPAEEAQNLMEQGHEDEALAMIQNAASQDDADAISYLARLYDNGRVVEQDFGRAANLYRDAAGMGVAYAQWRLGVMIDEDLTDNGTQEEAVALFESAAEQGFTNAMVSLGVMQSTGHGTPQDFTAARANFERAAHLGNVHAFNEIGIMYALGEGVPVDNQEALAWLFVAMVRSDEKAEQVVGELFDKIEPDLALAEKRMREIEDAFGLEPATNINFSGEPDHIGSSEKEI